MNIRKYNIKFEEMDDEEVSVLTLEDGGALSATERKVAECLTDSIDIELNYRFWRAFLIHMVSNVEDDIEVLRERLYLIELDRMTDMKSHNV